MCNILKHTTYQHALIHTKTITEPKRNNAKLKKENNNNNNKNPLNIRLNTAELKRTKYKMMF